MSRHHLLQKSLINVIKNNRDGSQRTQNDRRKSLLSIFDTLYASGYQLDHVRYVKPKHIYQMVNSWQASNLSPGTMKNRMSHLRWLLGKLGKADLIPSNDKLAIEKRTFVTGKDKSRELTQEELNNVNDLFMQHSLQAQRLFGLRVEESLKLQPFVADKGDKLFIKGSWAKGGRARDIPIITQAQRQWLINAKQLVKYKSDSLIPSNTQYHVYKERFYKRCQRAGIYHLHGHRHAYVHARFKALTGHDCPVKGGPSRKSFTVTQRKLDDAARLQLAEELGHSRQQISRNYCD